MKKNKKPCEIDQCPLYKIRGHNQLEKIIGIEISKINEARSDKNYRVWIQEKPGKKAREIQEPNFLLHHIHKKIANHLLRVKVPDYLYSGIKSRSHIKNAIRHIGNHPILTLDISEFYKSVTKKSVYWFFREKLKMANDIAGLLAEICTYQGHIPTGSCLSMPLAYFTSSDMFNKLHKISCNKEITMTVYVDDITFSGNNVDKKFKKLIKNEIHASKFSVKSSKTKLFKKYSPKIITGVVIKEKSISVRNKQHEIITELRGNSDQKKLISHLYAAGQIEPNFKRIAQKVQSGI